MKNANVTWTDPTELESGRPLSLDHVRVELSADLGVNFGLLDDVVAGTEELYIPDLEDAEYVVRLTAVAADGRESAPVTANFIIDNSDPKPVTNVQVELS